ncbi:MAG: hypothetical protein KC486_29500 [Myxococcales bacterium]|nr:hypothetical protein [Myxococcales bacterium]
MKKLVITVVALAALGVAGALVYTQYASPTARMCQKIEEQCGADVLPAEGCRESFASASASELDDLTRCVEPSGSCLESLGCISGSALRNLGRGFARGVVGP